MNLCTYSKSEVYNRLILQSCPLDLNTIEAKTCPCRKRVYTNDLRVLSCTFPKTWNGEEIKHPERFRERLKEGRKLAKVAIEEIGDEEEENEASEERADKSKHTESEASMNTATATSTTSATDKAGATNAAGGKSLWGRVAIPILGVTGEKFSGKTLFVSTIAPERTLMIDLEKSSETYSIPFAERWDLYEELQNKSSDPSKTPTPMEAYLAFRERLQSIKPGEFSVVAVDPISDIEQGLTDWVYANPQAFGRTRAQYDRATGLLFGDVKSHWKMMLGMLSSKVETFAFTTHMGNVWKGSAPTDQRKAKGKETLYELASLYIHLERKADKDGKVPKVPDGVTAPPIGKSRLAIVATGANGELEVTPCLPVRIPACTPAKIRWYIENPPDLAKPKKGETLELHEMTDEEKLRIEAEIAENKRAASEADLNRMQMMREAAEKQRVMKEAQQAKAAAAVTSAASAPPAGTAMEAKQPEPAQELETKNPAPEPDVYETIEAQRRELKIHDTAWAKVLAARNVATTRELTPAQAEEIRGNLWRKLTERDMQKN